MDKYKKKNQAKLLLLIFIILMQAIYILNTFKSSKEALKKEGSIIYIYTHEDDSKEVFSSLEEFCKWGDEWDEEAFDWGYECKDEKVLRVFAIKKVNIIR